MRLYAKPEDLTTEWVDEAPANAARLIRHASLQVEQATFLARYSVDDAGYPTDPEVVAAFRDAVLQQVATWTMSGLDPDKGVAGQTPKIASQSAGGGSVSYSGVATVAEIQRAITTLCDASLAILRSAGLLADEVVIYK